ncbi:matrixin domain protein [Bacteriovorax sp. Seq25_V]|nr:matrixin domain protein [Bacteriovorax sp. Seq25_V]
MLAAFTSCTPQQKGSANIGSPSASEYSNLPMKWPDSKLPLRVYIADEYHAEIDNYSLVSGKDLFQQMMDKWNLADSNRTFFDTTTDYSAANLEYNYHTDYGKDNVVGIYRKNASWFSDIGSGVLAVTSYIITPVSGYMEMVKGDIIVNEAEFNFTLDSTDSTYGRYDLPSVLLHELGHLIGLKHTTSYSIPSVMRPEIGHTDTHRNPYTYDVNSIQSLYNTTYSAITAGGLAITSESSDEEPRYYQGYIELRADGKCRHYLEGELIDTHSAF